MESRFLVPTSSVMAFQSADASRSFLGRSSNPISVRKVFSAGPPAERFLRTTSAIAADLGRRVVARCVTQSTQPSISARTVSILSSAWV